MKKVLYYMSPFILFPIFALVCEFLDDNIVRMYPYVFLVGLALICAVIGIISPSDKKFDYLITAIVPLSFFCLMFIGGFLDKDDMGGRFLIDRAFHAAFQQGSAFIVYCLTGAITFVSSYKKIRMIKRNKS